MQATQIHWRLVSTQQKGHMRFSRIGFCLISDELPRSTSVLDALTFAGITEISRSYFPSHQIGNSNHQNQSQRLSRGELACRIAHDQAFQNWRGQEWLFIFEDDAILTSDQLIPFLEELANTIKSRPTVITLYQGRWTIQEDTLDTLGNFNLVHHLIPPDGAVCYAINSAALQLRPTSTTRYLRPADWPEWMRPVTFLGLREPFVEELVSPSRIDQIEIRMRYKAFEDFRSLVKRFVRLFDVGYYLQRRYFIESIFQYLFWEWQVPMKVNISRIKQSTKS